MGINKILFRSKSIITLTLQALLFGALLCSFSNAGAQVDRVEQVIDGKTYYIHIVEKGHTLYAISKLYGVEVEDIISQNPEAEKGLSIGQTLRIPAREDADATAWENPIRIEDGFLIHRVMRGETLYGISSMYKVDINDVLEQNPKANGGIKKGMELQIPQNEVDQNYLMAIEPPVEDSLKHHLVMKGETLYSISKLYRVSIEDILAVNGGLEEGLSAGAEIRIPVLVVDAETGETQISMHIPDTLMKTDDFNIGLLLPFQLNYLDSMNLPLNTKRLQRISLSFYRGAVMADDSLQKYGLNANVVVEDVYDIETAEIAMAKDYQLVIGPFQKSAIKKSLEVKHNVATHMVCPVPQSSRVLLLDQNVSKVDPSPLTDIAVMAQYIAANHHNENVVLINSGFARDALAVEEFKRWYAEGMLEFPAAIGSIHELKATAKDNSINGLKAQLSVSLPNVVVVPSGKNARTVIADLFTDLGLLDQASYEVVVYGTHEWLNFDFLDINYKNRFNLRIPGHEYVNYNDSITQNWINEFRHKYNTDPDEYAFLGYDIMMYYGMGLATYGTDFPNHFDAINQDNLLYKHFDYFKTGVESGYENRAVIMMEHRDFELVPIE